MFVLAPLSVGTLKSETISLNIKAFAFVINIALNKSNMANCMSWPADACDLQVAIVPYA
jgi:hypothetical protein